MLATTLVMGMGQAAALPMAWRVEHVSDEETGVRHCAVVALGRMPSEVVLPVIREQLGENVAPRDTSEAARRV